jgi:hypothetical protein
VSPRVTEGVADYDVSGVEPREGAPGIKAPLGTYDAKIRICNDRRASSNGEKNDFEVAVEILGAELEVEIDGEMKTFTDFDWIFSYVSFNEAADWKLAEFVNALDLPPKGKLKAKELIGKTVRVKLNHDTYEGEYSPRIGRWMKPLGGSNGDGPTSSEDDGPTATAEATSYPDGFEPSREGDEFGSYDDWSDEDVKAEFDDRGLKASGRGKPSRDKMVDALRADDAAAEGGEAEPDANAEEGGDDYDTWEVEELESQFSERGLDLPSKPRGSNAKERYKTALIAGLREDDNTAAF